MTTDALQVLHQLGGVICPECRNIKTRTSDKAAIQVWGKCGDCLFWEEEEKNRKFMEVKANG